MPCYIFGGGELDHLEGRQADFHLASTCDLLLLGCYEVPGNGGCINDQ